MQTDVFYVESESTDNVYYFVKFKPDLIVWCSCRDNSTRGLKCKHLWSIEFAIRFDTLKEIDKLPADVKRDTSLLISPKPEQIAATIEAKLSYKDENYSFWLVIAELMLVPSNNEDKVQYKKLFTIQYTKKELDKITLDFVTQMNNYIASLIMMTKKLM